MSAVPAVHDTGGLQALLDERAVIRQLGTLARILDTRAWDRVSEVIADDVTFDYGTAGDEEGIEALLANFRRYLDVCGPSQHMLGSILVDVDGDHATSRAYVRARHAGRGELTGRIFDSNGEYIDRWERRPEGWRMVRRDARWAVHSGDSAVIGF